MIRRKSCKWKKEKLRPSAKSKESKHCPDELQKEIELANKKTPQHDVHELANQLILFEKLHCLYENNQLEKCMLSAYIFMTRTYRLKNLKHLEFDMNELDYNLGNPPKIWLRGAKLPPYGQ